MLLAGRGLSGPTTGACRRSSSDVPRCGAAPLGVSLGSGFVTGDAPGDKASGEGDSGGEALASARTITNVAVIRQPVRRREWNTFPINAECVSNSINYCGMNAQYTGI